MKFEDVKIGMKVIPVDKSIGINFQNSNSIKDMKDRNQSFLYVTHQHAEDRGKDRKFLLSAREEDIGICGDYFMASDFNKYNEGDKL